MTMRVRPWFTVVVLSIAFAFGVQAAEHTKGKTHDPCADSMLGTAGQSDCYHNRYTKADAELNRVYGQLMSKLDSQSQKDALRDAQRAWISYRDKECDFDASQYEGGTFENIANTACLYGET